MATKKELEARIAALEVEVALLRAEQASQRQPIVIQPYPTYPQPTCPGTWPYVTYTCGSGTSGTLTVSMDD